MEKMKMHSPNLTQENITRIRELLPGCVTEAKGKDGKVRLAVDFDQLRQELSESVVEGPQERYHLNWPGKREALLTANAPIAKTLRPCREESVDFYNTKNLFIEGDNLDALKLLQETYLGKVKMIYIDPPYNTGNDFIYEDDFAENTDAFLKRSNQKDEVGNRLVSNTEANGRFHSDWLSMVYARLKLAWHLLTDDGVIFVSIDQHEIVNIQHIMSEVYGEDNHVATLTVINNMKGRNDQANVATCHEYLIIFTKGGFVSKGLPLTEEQLSAYKYEDDNGERYALRDLRKRGRPDRREDRPNMFFPIFWDEIARRCSLQRESQEQVEITPQRGDGTDGRWRWGKDRVAANLGNLHPRFSTKKQRWDIDHRVYLNPFVANTVGDEEVDDDDKDFERTSKTKSFWWGADISTDVANREFKKLLPEINPDYPKSPFLIEKLLRMAASGTDIVLDFFAGYATTAHAVMQLNAEDGGNRKFIMVQLPELCDEKSEAFMAGYKNIAEISKERIRRAGKKVLEGECHDGWSKDVGFRVFKVDSSNMADVYYTPDAADQSKFQYYVDNIKPDRTSEDMLFQVLVDWGVDLSLPIRKETIQSKTVFFVNEPPYDLVACFDTGVNEDLVKELAQFAPLRVVFRDAGFATDAAKINVEQIFKQMSPGTDVKSI